MGLDTYEMIEMFGLTERADDLPIPNDDVLRDEIVREAFEALVGGLSRTGLHGEIEPLAHGFASLFHRRRLATSGALTKVTDTLKGLIRAADGSEVIETEIEEAQRQADRLRDLLDGLEVMAEASARCYEVETGRAYMPPSGGRTGRMASLTGAVFEARAWLEADERAEAARFRIEGLPLAVAGERDWIDHARVWDILDRTRVRFQQGLGSDLVLYHKGDRKGVDAIAAAWARSRAVAQVTFQPNWRAFGKRAGFRAIDQMFETPKRLGGVVIFGSTGIALNLAEKAEAKGIRVLRVGTRA
ncbi:DUF2493 domain-containing protein [Ruegeria sp.]|uniref:DUF2493 domain-containing protein n=1 Tax=Ruegeria sp. TaxID=1879320 RepID=UPI003B00D2E0